MKTFPRKAGIAAMLALFTLSVACGGGGGNSDYPAEVRNNFITSCTESGGSRSECQCALDGIEDAYTLEEFIKLEQTLDTNIPDKLVDIIADCTEG